MVMCTLRGKLNFITNSIVFQNTGIVFHNSTNAISKKASFFRLLLFDMELFMVVHTKV